jgi:hypothetical protein
MPNVPNGFGIPSVVGGLLKFDHQLVIPAKEERLGKPGALVSTVSAFLFFIFLASGHHNSCCNMPLK